jgi:hypothetical protein
VEHVRVVGSHCAGPRNRLSNWLVAPDDDTFGLRQRERERERETRLSLAQSMALGDTDPERNLPEESCLLSAVLWCLRRLASLDRKITMNDSRWSAVDEEAGQRMIKTNGLGSVHPGLR